MNSLNFLKTLMEFQDLILLLLQWLLYMARNTFYILLFLFLFTFFSPHSSEIFLDGLDDDDDSYRKTRSFKHSVHALLIYAENFIVFFFFFERDLLNNRKSVDMYKHLLLRYISIRHKFVGYKSKSYQKSFFTWKCKYSDCIYIYYGIFIFQNNNLQPY